MLVFYSLVSFSFGHVLNSGDATLLELYDSSGLDSFPQINFLVNNNGHFDFVSKYTYFNGECACLEEAFPEINKQDLRYFNPP